MPAMPAWYCHLQAAANKIKIKDAIDNLEAGGSTAGGEGIKLAYKIAKENFIKKEITVLSLLPMVILMLVKAVMMKW